MIIGKVNTLILSLLFSAIAFSQNTGFTKDTSYLRLIIIEMQNTTDLDSIVDLSKTMDSLINFWLVQEPSKSEKNIILSYRAEIADFLGTTYYYDGDIEKGLSYYEQSALIYEEINKTGLLGTMYNNMGFLKEDLGRYPEAILAYTKALEYGKENNNKHVVSNAYSNLAYSFSLQGNVAKALEYNFKSLKLREEIDDMEGVSISYNNIGIIYDDQKNYTKAKEFYKKSMAIDEILEYTNGLGYGHNNIGMIHYNQGIYDSALQEFNTALEYMIESDDLYGEGLTYNNIGMCHYFNKDYNTSLKFHNKSLKIRELTQEESEIANSLNNLSLCYIDLNQIIKAEELASKAMEISERTGHISRIAQSAQVLYQIYKSKGNDSKALAMYELKVQTEDSTTNMANASLAIQTQYQYEYEKKTATDSIIQEEELKVKNAEIEATNAKAAIANQQKWYLFGGLSLTALFGLFMFNRFRITRNQRDIIKDQSRLVSNQKLILEETNKDLNDSIKYAQRLQSAILPSKAELIKEFEQIFVFFKPKDVVSGDFYWMQKTPLGTLVAVADCTGHGVPGAMVSVVCSNALNRSVNEYDYYQPDKVLEKTRELVIETFARSGNDIKDGMDISLCLIDQKQVTFSGANNPLWLVKPKNCIRQELKEARGYVENEKYGLIEYKGNKQPVGLHSVMTEFQSISFDREQGDQIFIFTDGYADQFGGHPDKGGKKLKYKPFKRLLLKFADQESIVQNDRLNVAFEEWQGSFEQVDDVCLIGIKL